MNFKFLFNVKFGSWAFRICAYFVMKPSGHYSREKDLRYVKVVKSKKMFCCFFSNEYGTGEVMADAVVMPKILINPVLIEGVA